MQFVRVPLDGVPNAGVVRVGEVSVLFVSVSDPARVTKVPVVGSVTLVAAVEVKVVPYAPTVAKVAPFAMVKVAEVAGAVIATLFTLVAVATPRVGVVRLGEVSVLFVSVCVSEVPTTVPEGAERVAILPSPKLVRAVAASLAPVPPSATARSVIPVIVPPVIATEEGT